MKGAGLRLSNSGAGEGERGLMLRGGNSQLANAPRFAWVRLPHFQKISARQQGEGQSKNTPGPFSCLGRMP